MTVLPECKGLRRALLVEIPLFPWRLTLFHNCYCFSRYHLTEATRGCVFQNAKEDQMDHFPFMITN